LVIRDTNKLIFLIEWNRVFLTNVTLLIIIIFYSLNQGIQTIFLLILKDLITLT